jgi:hypothetical protein
MTHTATEKTTTQPSSLTSESRGTPECWPFQEID